MEDFPKIACSQVAIVRAERRTGQIFDVNYELLISSDQKTYLVFDNKVNAIAYILEMAKVKKGFEYILYDKDFKVIEFLTPE